MEYLNTILCKTFDERTQSVITDASPDDSKITVLDENWQPSKCVLLGITFKSVGKQPSDLVGKPLSKYEPELTGKIKGDGNCLFRSLYKIITGSENSHLQIHSIICRFFSSEGTTKLGWYFKSKQTTPCHYLTHDDVIYRESIWGSDVEIMAASAILNANIYVGNNDYRMPGFVIRHMRWSLLRSTNSPTANLYIKNFVLNYKPVVSMLRYPIPKYGTTTDEFLTV